MLIARHISKSFHHKKILRDITFKINAGEHVALLGPNGAGKTTLLKILAGIVRPLTGTATLNDQKMFTEDASHRKDLIFWGHSALFYPALTGFENLTLFIALRHENVSAEVIRAELTKYHLEDCTREPVRTYSAGMLQRLTMIKLSLSHWELALIDEPTTGLDIEGLRYLKQLSEHWKAQGKTIIFSTHDSDWVTERADRIILIKKGVVAFDSTGMENLDVKKIMQGEF